MINISNNLEVINITYPKEWNYIAQQILYLFSEYGLDAIKDCKASCTKKSSHVIDCYNIFNAAVAAYNAKRTKEANLIINYLKGQLNLYYVNISVGTNKLYIGCGLSTDDVINENNLITDIKTIVGDYEINVTQDTKIYIIFSKALEYNSIQYNNFEIPFEELDSIIVNDEEFRVLVTTNTYNEGNYTINIK